MLKFVDVFVDDNVVVGDDKGEVDVEKEAFSNTNDTPLDEFYKVHKQIIEFLDREDALHRESLAEPTLIKNDEEVCSNTLDGIEELYD